MRFGLFSIERSNGGSGLVFGPDVGCGFGLLPLPLLLNFLPKLGGGFVVDRLQGLDGAEQVRETIHTTLKSSMPSSQIESFTFDYGNPTFVDVVVTSDLEQESEAFQSEVHSAKEALEEALDIPVRLSVEISKE